MLRNKYMAVSLIIASVSVLFFIRSFEKKEKHTGRTVLVSVMTALSLAGRFIPLLKPVTALVVITGIWLGPEAGFLTGALTMLISDIWFGQGPWTPFQMAACGITGLAAGFLSPLLKKSRGYTVVYGLICGIVYSFIMDIWTVLSYSPEFSLSLYRAALVTAVPYTVSYSLSGALWLLLFYNPFGRKFKRIIKKYRL